MDAEKKKRYENISAEVVKLAGGRDNILGIAHCATRLRLVLEDNDKADIHAIEDVDLVKGVFVAGDQLQIIFGAGLVNDVCQVMADSLHMDSMSLGDLKSKPEIYFEKKDTYIAEASSEMRRILDRLWQFYEALSPFYMKLSVLELLHLLLDSRNVVQEKTLTFYTNIQVEMAKKAEQILTADLKQHIPVKQIAQQFGISETSLKNYFRGVYGKNVSAYLRDLRMNIAEKLLIETKLPISEIASRVGYTKQGKFAEVFRQQFQMNPLEYRRSKKLEKILE